MSERTRPLLALYALDRPKLQAFAKELKELLLADDRSGLASALGLGAELSDRLGRGPRAVDWFLRPDTDPQASPLFASLRRVAKKRALELAWTSDAPSLEGRLRAFEPLRDEPQVAVAIDKLLDANRLPWFLVRPGATGGWLDGAAREALAIELRALKPVLTPELAAFAEAVDEIDGPVLAHDGL